MNKTENKLVEKLEIAKKELENLQTIVQKMLNAINTVETENQYKIEEILSDICEFYGDCVRCPLVESCKFARNGCTETFQCETCPRLRQCVFKGSKGLFIYIRDSKLGGGL
jgi:adenine-specific DNA glycosylase